MTNNGPPRNFYGVLKEHLIGHVLRKQNGGFIDNVIHLTLDIKWLNHPHGPTCIVHRSNLKDMLILSLDTFIV